MSVQHQLHQNEALRHALASEYVLGLLRGGARRRFEAWLPDNAALRQAVSEWQQRLQPLAELGPQEAPPAQVWRNIAARLKFSAVAGRDKSAMNQAMNQSIAQPPSWWQRLSGSLSFWRNVGLASTVMATMLVAIMLTRQIDTGAPVTSYVATLSDDKGQPVLLVTNDARRGELVIKVVTPQAVADNKSLELWAVPKAGAPRSLGLVPSGNAGEVFRLKLPAEDTPQSIPLLAITLEPKGGSPDPKGATGPIVYKGAWLQI